MLYTEAAMTERLKHILRGMGSLIVLMPTDGPAERLERVRTYRTDAEAMRDDWNQVGRDLRLAFDAIVHGQEETPEE